MQTGHKRVSSKMKQRSGRDKNRFRNKLQLVFDHHAFVNKFLQVKKKDTN
jgi:hypothetical protein